MQMICHANTFKCVLKAENSMTGRAYMGESAEPSLAESHQEMSELLDKQVNAQKKKTFGSYVNCAMKMKVRRINDARIKMLFMEGSPL